MTYYDLTIEKYLQIREVLENIENDLDTQVQLLCVLNECSEDAILDLPLTDYQKKVSELNFLYEPLIPAPKCPKTVSIGGQTYEIIRDIKKLTAGQYIDYQTLINDKDFYGVLPNILACFFIPKGKTYGQDYDIVEVAENIRKNLSIGFANDVGFFFLRKSKHLINRMLDYLVWMTKREMRKTRKPELKEKMTEALRKLKEMRASFQNGVGGTI